MTLAIPRDWWGYEPTGMVGLVITAWSRGSAIFPVEAAVVWLAAPFSCIFIYEFANAFFHHPGLDAASRCSGRHQRRLRHLLRR